MIKISFNGEVREFAAEGKSYIELLSAVDPKLLSSYVAVKDGEEIVDLRDIPADGACVELVGLESKDALHVLRHTATHIMAEAVKHLFPEAKLTIGPATVPPYRIALLGLSIATYTTTLGSSIGATAIIDKL